MATRDQYSVPIHDSSSESAVAVTPSDTAILKRQARGIYVGVTGDLKVQFLDGSQITFVAVPAGAILPIRVDIVLSTGTTATSIVALF